jgi:deoxyribodipyrimidine photolyase-related protein
MELTLVYSHQLFKKHPSVALGRPIWLIEDPLLFGNDPHWPTNMHQQKLLLHRASMKAYAVELQSLGHQVHYVDVPEGAFTSSEALLKKHLPKKLNKVYLADPADSILMKRVRRFAKAHGVELVVSESPNFVSPSDFLATHLLGKKKPFMATFYEAQRKRMKILVEANESPMGGAWSFDTENRKKLPKNHRPPQEPTSRGNSFTVEATTYIQKKFPRNLGSVERFRWPVTRIDAERWLEQFIEQRLADFGVYEDAISTQHAYLNHAAITPMLNIGLLDVSDVISRILRSAKSQHVPLNSLEGFIRQIIGWREFMHGIYRHRGTDIRTKNFWGFTRPMPPSFYNGTTGIGPVDRVIRQLLTDGYCHHIERLMVLGNFMLLCRIHPNEVYRWFMEMYVDSYDWVMVPNVYGMSQFADGGTFTTKPYISGSNYILKMSDEPKGPWCEIWDGLFWSFIADHEAFFLKNPRLAMMARTWQKQSPEKQAVHRRHANEFLAAL